MGTVAPSKTKLAAKALWKGQGLHIRTSCGKLTMALALLFASVNTEEVVV